MISYQEFLNSLAHTQYTDDDYYSLIIYFKDDILMDIAKLNQGIIAKRLGLNITKFSFMLFLLKRDIELTQERIKSLEAIDYDNYSATL